MKTIRQCLFLLALFAGMTGLRAQQPAADTGSYSFSLRQAVDYAVANNTNMKNSALDQVAARNKVREVTGMGLPQISGSVEVQDFIELPTSVIPAEFFGGPAGTFVPVQFGTKWNATAGFSASQLLFSGSYIYGVKGAKVYQELALKNTDRTRIETSADVTKAYYTALVNVEQRILIDANLERLKKMMDDTKALFENGFVEKIDLDRITVTYNNLTTEADNIRRLLDLSLVMLKYQMGMDQNAKLTLTDDIRSINFSPEIPQTGKFDYTSRVEYRLMELNLRGNVLTMRAERAGYIPNAALFASWQYQAYRSKFDFFDTNQKWYPIGIVGLRINVPIFDGLQRNYRIQQAKVGILKAENDLLFMQRTIDMEQAVTRVTLQNSAARLQTQKANMELAQNVLDVAQKKFSSGVGSNLEVVSAQTAFKEAQTNYFDALYDAVIAKVDYDKSMGVFAR
jgi:outer membrane protein TolC